MIAIANFRACWHPGANTFGIDVKLVDGRSFKLPVNAPEEFIALLAVLNGPGPAMSDSGNIVCER